MMKKIYSKNGDNGQTALINGEKLAKNSLVFEVLGTLDEFNSSLGLLLADWDQLLFDENNRLDLKDLNYQKNFLFTLQKQLFKFGAEIAKSKTVKLQNQFLISMEKNIERFLEQFCFTGWQSISSSSRFSEDNLSTIRKKISGLGC